MLLGFLLMLSFNDRLHVKSTLPAVVHIITMVLATGSAALRASIHGIIVNVTQSICTSVTLDDSATRTLQSLLTEMTASKFILQVRPAASPLVS